MKRARRVPPVAAAAGAGSGRFADLDFEGFRALAADPALSPHEKVGFPDSYRAGKERAILRDVTRKLSHLRRTARRVLDIGPGCSPVATALMSLCQRHRHHLFLIDSPEMLAHLPAELPGERISGRFPQDCLEFLAQHRERLDAILAYSVIQYVFAESDIFSFFDQALALLAPGGQLLLGDIPNGSMRQRFFAAPSGQAFHRRFTGSGDPLPVELNVLQPGRIDDAVLLGLVMRARAAGFHAFLLPQSPDLPMANRREDLLVVKP
jgi:hypothetical protein